MSKQQLYPRTLRTHCASHALHTSHALFFARTPYFARLFSHALLTSHALFFRTLSFRAHSSFCTFFFFFACTLTSHALLSGARAMVSFGSCSSERCLKCVQFCPQLLKFCNNPEPFLLPICAQSATESTIVKAHRF